MLFSNGNSGVIGAIPADTDCKVLNFMSHETTYPLEPAGDSIQDTAYIVEVAARQ